MAVATGAPNRKWLVGMRITAILYILLGALFVSLACAAPIRLEPSNVRVAVDLIAADLKGPTGIVADPELDLLYVAESRGNRIVQIQNKQKQTFIGGDFQIDAESLPHYFRLNNDEEASWSAAGFRSPYDIGFDSSNRFYVAEDGAGGRLLRFDDFAASGAEATIVRTPLKGGDYGYSSILFDPDDRFYLTARKNKPTREVPFGNVLMRDNHYSWWMIDYGPFADFAPLSIDRTGRYMIIGEQRIADIVWYDLQREVPIGEMKQLYGLRHLASLADGSTMAIIERDDKTWSLVEIDPLKAMVYEWIGDLPRIGCLYTHPRTDDLYASQPDEGKVVRFRKLQEDTTERGNKLDKLRMKFEDQNNYPPERWPKFLKSFFQELDVLVPVDFTKNPRLRIPDKPSPRRHMTLEQFAEMLPLIAGKFKATYTSKNGNKPRNPITEISFLMLAPSSRLFSKRSTVESLSLLSVTRADGKSTNTRILHDILGASPRARRNLPVASEQVFTDPLGFISGSVPLHVTNRVRLVFTSVIVGPEYEFDLYANQHEKSVMKVIYKQRTDKYSLEPLKEDPAAGGESFLVANCQEIDYGWHALGDTAIIDKIVIGEGPEMKFRHAVNFNNVQDNSFLIKKSIAPIFGPRFERADLVWPRIVISQAGELWPAHHY